MAEPTTRATGRGVPLGLLAPCTYVVAVGVAVAVSQRIHVGPGPHQAALFVHLASVLVGFGAVLVVEWCGLLWLLRRATLADALHVAGLVVPLIWLGVGGLLVSGTLLHPDLGAGWTLLKMAAVAALGVNGVYVGRLRRTLDAAGPEMTQAQQRLLFVSAGVSQACWWTAVAVGFLSSQG